MKSVTSYFNMLSFMEQTIDELRAEGNDHDALMLLASESIIRAHFGSRPQFIGSVMRPSELMTSSSQ